MFVRNLFLKNVAMVIEPVFLTAVFSEENFLQAGRQNLSSPGIKLLNVTHLEAQMLFSVPEVKSWHSPN